MSKINLKVNITPEKAFNIIRNRQTAELVHEEFSNIGEGKSIGTLIFEKYYMRASNRAALVVIMDNFKGETSVRVISTGSSQGMIFNFDWGAAKNFTNSIKDILQDYIIEYSEF